MSQTHNWMGCPSVIQCKTYYFTRVKFHRSRQEVLIGLNSSQSSQEIHSVAQISDNDIVLQFQVIKFYQSWPYVTNTINRGNHQNFLLGLWRHLSCASKTICHVISFCFRLELLGSLKFQDQPSVYAILHSGGVFSRSFTFTRSIVCQSR